MGASVLSYSGVNIGTGTGADQALRALPNSELPIENGDWQGGSSSSSTPQVADMTPRDSSTDSEKFLAQSESVRGVLPLYSSAPSSTDDYTSARNSEAPVLAPTSTQTYHYLKGETEFIGTPTDTSISGSHADPSAPSYTAKPSSDDSMLNPTSSTSADTPSASSLDRPSPEVMLGALTLTEC